MNYLIVDDEVILLRDMERLAREVLPEDSQIYTADNWKSALHLVEQYKPYVVFLDVDMPEMNGLQISGRIEEISPKSNIIFVTGFPEYSLDAWNTNASDFLVKPVLKTTNDPDKAITDMAVMYMDGGYSCSESKNDNWLKRLSEAGPDSATSDEYDERAREIYENQWDTIH